MSSKEIDPRLSGYRQWEGSDPFEEQTGPFYYRQEPDGSYRGGFLAGKRNVNKAGNIHGGALMTFADYSLFVFARKSLKGVSAVTVSFNAEFISPAAEGDFLESCGELVHETKRLLFVRGKIFCGSRVLLNISGILKKMNPRPKELPDQI